MQEGLEDHFRAKGQKNFRSNYLELWDKIIREVRGRAWPGWASSVGAVLRDKAIWDALCVLHGAQSLMSCPFHVMSNNFMPNAHANCPCRPTTPTCCLTSRWWTRS